MLEVVQDLIQFIQQEHGTLTPRVIEKPKPAAAPPPPPPPPPLQSDLSKVLPHLNWKTAAPQGADVAIVIGQETPPQRKLLERMGQALQKEGFSMRIAGPGELTEQHVIVTRQTMSASPLQRTLLFVIEDIDLYLREPQERRNLWNAILKYVR